MLPSRSSLLVAIALTLAACGGSAEDPVASEPADDLRAEAIANILAEDDEMSPEEAECYVDAVPVESLDAVDAFSVEFQEQFGEDPEAVDQPEVVRRLLDDAFEACYGDGAPFNSNTLGQADASVTLAMANLTASDGLSADEASCLISAFGEDDLGLVDNFSPDFQRQFDDAEDPQDLPLADGTIDRVLEAFQACSSGASGDGADGSDDESSASPTVAPSPGDRDLAIANLQVEPDPFTTDEAVCLADTFGEQFLGLVDDFSPEFRERYDRELEGQDPFLDDRLRNAVDACL